MEKMLKCVGLFMVVLVLVMGVGGDADAKKKMFKMINELVKYNIPVTYVDWKSEERDIAEMGSEKFEEIVTSGSVKSFTFEDQIKERLFS